MVCPTADLVMSHHRQGEYAVRRVRNAFAFDAYADLLADGEALLVLSPTVSRVYGREVEGLVAASGGVIARTLCVSGEPAKQMAAVEHICEAALHGGLSRNGVMVAMGGGICMDVVTVAASMYRRGIRHVRVPSTLVGQIDAGLGAKGAVNFAGRKNSVGCFHPPSLVIVDQRLLRTLPFAELRAGLAEIVKIALVSDCALFELLEATLPEIVDSGFAAPRAAAETILSLAALRMLEALDGNLFEQQSLRRTVDAGHTFSPKLEAASGFSLRHGEAVAIDLALSAEISTLLGLLAPSDCRRIVQVLGSVGLPITSAFLTEQMCADALGDAILHRGGNLNLPLFRDIGSPTFWNSRTEIEGVLPIALGNLADAAAGPRPAAARSTGGHPLKARPQVAQVNV